MHSRKLKIASAFIAIIIVAGGAGVLLTHNSPSPKPTTKQTSASKAPVSPAVVVKSPAAYKNTVVVLVGYVVKSQKDKNDYYVVSVEDKPSAIKLDFSKTTLNPDDYADYPGESSKTSNKHKGTFRVTGKYLAAGKQQPTIQVQSIQ